MATRPPGAAKPMSVHDHHVARCAIAHQTAMRAARALGPNPSRAEERAVSALTIALIHLLHRLETLVAEMGAEAVYGTPPREFSHDELERLFPPENSAEEQP